MKEINSERIDRLNIKIAEQRKSEQMTVGDLINELNELVRIHPDALGVRIVMVDDYVRDIDLNKGSIEIDKSESGILVRIYAL